MKVHALPFFPCVHREQALQNLDRANTKLNSNQLWLVQVVCGEGTYLPIEFGVLRLEALTAF